MKHVSVHADMRGVIDIPELGLVGSEDDELIITLFLGCIRGGFVDIGVALLARVLSLFHSLSTHRPYLGCSRQVCLS